MSHQKKEEKKVKKRNSYDFFLLDIRVDLKKKVKLEAS